MTNTATELREQIKRLREILSLNNNPGANPSALHSLGIVSNAIAGIDPEAGSKTRELMDIASKFYDAEKWKRSKDSPEALYSRMSFEILGWLDTRANIHEHFGAKDA